MNEQKLNEIMNARDNTAINELAERVARDKRDETAAEMKAAAAAGIAIAPQWGAVEETTYYDLLRTEIPPIKWAVKEFIAEGLTIIAAEPKLGKSVLALNLALSVTTGRDFLGQPTEIGDVLYLQLEDTKRRTKQRGQRMGYTEYTTHEAAKRLTIVTQAPRQHEGGTLYIEDWISRHPEARLIIIDTLQKFRKPVGNKQMYEADYECISQLHDLAVKHNVSIIIIHHTKKQEETNIQNMISGSQGIAGSVDGILLLYRPSKVVRDQAILLRRGRDIDDAEFLIQRNRQAFTWELMGDPSEFTANEGQQNILNCLREHGPMTPKEIAEELEQKPASIRTWLKRLAKADRVTKKGGKYSLAGHEEDFPLKEKEEPPAAPEEA